MELQDADDVTLVLALRDGDPRAPRVLWQRYATKVHRILRRALGPSNDVEDLAQEVFLTVFRKAGAMRTPAALGAYITSVAALTGRSRLRRQWGQRWHAAAALRPAGAARGDGDAAVEAAAGHLLHDAVVPGGLEHERQQPAQRHRQPGSARRAGRGVHQRVSAAKTLGAALGIDQAVMKADFVDNGAIKPVKATLSGITL